jgi:hypothetical protein
MQSLASGNHLVFNDQTQSSGSNSETARPSNPCQNAPNEKSSIVANCLSNDSEEQPSKEVPDLVKEQCRWWREMMHMAHFISTSTKSPSSSRRFVQYTGRTIPPRTSVCTSYAMLWTLTNTPGPHLQTSNNPYWVRYVGPKIPTYSGHL